MFYLKEDGKKLIIRADNVYTICPRCGREHAVDLSDVALADEFEIEFTHVFCGDCTKEFERRWNKTQPNEHAICEPLIM